MSEKKKSFEKRLSVYLGVASGVLLIHSGAEAQVQYSGLRNLTVNSSNTSISVDLNADGIVDFKFFFKQTYSTNYLGLSVNTTNGRRQWIGSTGNNDAAKLESTYVIKPDITALSLGWSVDTDSRDLMGAHYPGSSHDGNFNDQTGYLGVRFTSDTCTGTGGSGFHYGWIRFSGAADASQGTVIDWAYEDECDRGIRAGVRGVKTVPSLNEWGTVALIALLASGGMLALRRKKES